MIREILDQRLTGRSKIIDGVEYVERITEEFVCGGLGGRSLDTITEWVKRGEENLRGER